MDARGGSSYQPILSSIEPNLEDTKDTTTPISSKSSQTWYETLLLELEIYYQIGMSYLLPYKIPLMIFFSIFTGVVFYHYMNSWSISTATFYAVNTLLGELFMVPGNKTPVADVFTVLYYIYGAFFLAGILGQYVGVLVTKAQEMAATERKKLMEIPENPIDTDQDGYVGFWDHFEFHKMKLQQKIGWETHQWKYITFGIVILWICVGILYGMFMEHKEFGSALFFAVSTIAGACYVGPECDGGDDTDCDIGMVREILLTVYVLIGYPLFTILLGQFASLFIEHTVREHEKEILRSPLSEEEYRYAANLYGDDEVFPSLLSILELLRLQRVTVEDLDRIREIFNQVDVGSTGNLTKPMLAKSNLYRGYGSFDEVDFLREKTEEATPQGETELFHYLTENDRANSLPPDITPEMYHSVVDPRLFLDTSVSFAEEELPPIDSTTSFESPKKSMTSIRGSVASGGVSKGEETTGSQEKVGLERMSIRKYNEVVIPLAVSSVLEGLDSCDLDQDDLYGDGDY